MSSLPRGFLRSRLQLLASSSAAGDAVGLGRPIPPAVGRFDGGFEGFAREFGFTLALQLQIVEKFQEHDPGQERPTVEVAVQPLVLAHDVAGGFEQRAEGLGGGGESFYHSLSK